MDEIVIKYYRQMLQAGFEHSGKLESPSIFLDSGRERLHICSMAIHSYIHLYINISNDVIEDVKYLCICDPTANVVVELLCKMIKGKTIEEAEAITEDSFVLMTGSKGEEFLKRAKGIIELLGRGLTRYKTEVAQSS
jgi:NifU-like protein involved in Fe-S cluster formation